MNYYIHIADPGFREFPWPGVRRLGPFNTVEEAQAQAVSDAALGHGAALGVFNEDESMALAIADDQTGSPDVAHEVIRAEGQQAAQDWKDSVIQEEQQNIADIQAMLPPGVDAEQLLALAAERAAELEKLQSFRTPLTPPPSDEALDGTA